MANITWTDQMLNCMRFHADKGKSASKIADILQQEYKFTITRNAVIGKASRLGIKLSNHRNLEAKKELLAKKTKVIIEKTKITRPEKPSSFINRPLNKIKKPLNIHEQLDNVFKNPDALGIPLLELKENQCRYPLGDIKTNDLLFCGAPTEIGKPYSYCSFCYPIVYTPPRYRLKQATDKAP